MANKVKITDRQGTQVFPITHVSAVIDSNGNSVEQVLSAQTDLIQQAQLEAGAVPSDLAPTEGSSNWVTSGGVYTALSGKADADSVMESVDVAAYGFPSGTEVSGVTISNGVWTAQTQRRLLFYSYIYTKGDKLHIKGHAENGSYVAFLTSNAHTVNTNVDFAEGETGWNSVGAGEEASFTIPSDCTYICVNSAYVYSSSGTTYFTPQILEVTNSVAVDGGEAVVDIRKLFKAGEQQTLVNNQHSRYSDYASGSYTRGVYIFNVDGLEDWDISISIDANSTIKAAIQLWRDNNYGRAVVSSDYDSTWKVAGESYSVSKSTADGISHGVRVVAIPTTYISGNTGIPTWEEFTQYVSVVFHYKKNVGAAKDLAVKSVVSPYNYNAHLTTTSYLGDKITFDDNAYTWEKFTTNLQSAGSPWISRQGGAVYGDYLFQFHDTLRNICVYNLRTQTNVQKMTLTAITHCHANGGGFSKQFYTAGDPFPLLYISSMYESKVYVYRLTGTIGSLTAALIQTITIDTAYFNPDVAIDPATNKMVFYANTSPNALYTDGSETVVMACDIPAVSSAVTIDTFDGVFTIPCIFAQQGAFAWRGKMYISYGNAGATFDNGGIVVVDYLNKTVINLIGIDVMGDLEPEALGLWDSSIIVTSQEGEIYKMSF